MTNQEMLTAIRQALITEVGTGPQEPPIRVRAMRTPQQQQRDIQIAGHPTRIEAEGQMQWGVTIDTPGDYVPGQIVDVHVTAKNGKTWTQRTRIVDPGDDRYDIPPTGIKHRRSDPNT